MVEFIYVNLICWEDIILLLDRYTNHLKSFESIIDFTKKKDLVTKTGQTNINLCNDPIITIAAQIGDFHLVNMLIKLGANVNQIRMSKYALGNTALIEASRYGHSKIVKLLLSKKAEVNIKNYMGLSALMYAVINRHYDCVELLLKHGADANAKDNNNDTPLLLAAAKGYFEIVELLLKYHADINHYDNDGEDAYKLAIKSRRYNILTLLNKYKSENSDIIPI